MLESIAEHDNPSCALRGYTSVLVKAVPTLYVNKVVREQDAAPE